MSLQRCLVELARVVGLVACFALSYLALCLFLGMLSALGEVVIALLSLLLAWVITVGIGGSLTSGKRAVAAATACLAVATPFVFLQQAGKEFWEPALIAAPENVPEGWIAFRFVSAFGYLGSLEGQPLSGLELDLPWPHVGYYPVGVPENRMRWTGHDIYGDNKVRPWSRPETWFTKPLELSENPYSRLLWFRLAIERGKEVVFEKRYENGSVVITRDTRYLRFHALQEPYSDENIMAKACVYMIDEERVPQDSLLPGETVVLEGVFLVPQENENHVSIGDLGSWGRELKPEENRSPLVGFDWNGPRADLQLLVQLEKFRGRFPTIVEKFAENPENVPGYAAGFPDRVV